MTTEELLEQLEAEAQRETPVCVIDPDTRTITVPPEYQLLGVENDKRVERLYFQCPKIVGDNQDLSQDYQLFMNYQNANGDPDAYHIDDMAVDGDNITFSWLLEENVTKYRGDIQFAFGAIIPGDEAEDPDKNRWNTTINTDCTCLTGLKCTQQVAENNPDALAQIWAAIDELKAGGGGSGTPGKDGREIEIQNNGTAIQWRYVGDSDWTDLVQLSDLKGEGIPEGGTTGQVLMKKSDADYDAEWKNVSAGTSDQYFEMVESGTTTANGVSLDISGLLEAYPSSGTWDSLHNWYLTHYNSSNNIAVSNGIEAGKLVSKPIKGVCYFRGFASSSNQYIMNNSVRFYGCDSDKALEEEGHPCTLITSKKHQFFPVDELPDGSSGYGVIIVYPQEEYEYYYIELSPTYYTAGTPNKSNPTWIAAFDSTVLDDPLMSISSNSDTFLKMKDEYLSGYYKNMFASEDFKNIFRNYYAQMAPKVGTPQTYGKAIYVAGDSLHAYAGGDGISTAGFMTNWNQYLGFSIIVNAGYAGSTWSETTGGGGIKKAKALISAGTVYDVIILAWGTNDDTGGNGTIDDPASDAEGCTMVAAMKWIITNLRNTFKSTAIGVIIPPPKGTEDGMKTRGDLMIQVCELLHVPYVDMREYISISDLGSDTVHLGTGAGKYGAAEASLILRICQYGDTLYPGTTD